MADAEMLNGLQPIGHVRSPFTQTSDIPKGLGAQHEAEGTLEIRQELEAGLADEAPGCVSVERATAGGGPAWACRSLKRW